MVKRQGWASTAARIRPDPTQLGALRGRTGLFAERGAKLERAGALGAANGVAYHLERIGEAETRAAQTYRTSVEAQRKTDAISVPGLSPRAEAAMSASAAAPDERARADLWRAFAAAQAPRPRWTGSRRRRGDGLVTT